MRLTYGEAICKAFEYLFSTYENVFAIGQGLWSPWYVGNSMTDLDKKFGTDRVLDTPVSELACTGAAIGASLCGYRPIVVHPRMDFMLLAVDQIVNQAAKWSYMLGGQTSPAVTIRTIINRGNEQGAQHSQALHAWFAHIPGLRVVMPATAEDAYGLLIGSVLCDDPVVYIDDRWLYECEGVIAEDGIAACTFHQEGPKVRRRGCDITLVGAGYSSFLCEEVASRLDSFGIGAEVIDMRVINPLDSTVVLESVERIGRLCVIDGGWRTAGLAAEIIARSVEALSPTTFRMKPMRLTLPDAPAPTSRWLEDAYYPKADALTRMIRNAMGMPGNT